MEVNIEAQDDRSVTSTTEDAPQVAPVLEVSTLETPAPTPVPEQTEQVNAISDVPENEPSIQIESKLEVSNTIVPIETTQNENSEKISLLNSDKVVDSKSPQDEAKEVASASDELFEDSTVTNDQESESTPEITEKDPNKSISRELKSLIESAKESKIINECTLVKTKMRKSRILDTSNSSPNSSLDSDKIQGRRSSNNSQISNSSEKSEIIPKRSMRSQNQEFVNKHKQFLNSVMGKIYKIEDSVSDIEAVDESKSNDISAKSPKRKKYEKRPEMQSLSSAKLRSDLYCWRCHWSIEHQSNDKSPIHIPAQCSVCPRSYHYKCLTTSERAKFSIDKNWVCPECLIVLHAESYETRSPALKKISLTALCTLLKYALKRMMDVNGAGPFLGPVDRAEFPDYDKYVVHPMDLSLMKQNIEVNHYGSTEAFMSDAQWILHNSIIFNTLQSKLTANARALLRSCRTEMGEIEACPECYAAAHGRRATWFTDVCSTPHILLWAKLKGFPYWPAKGMSVNSSGMIDVRFFGAHDRAWVPVRDCYLYSDKDPNNFRTKRQDILDSMQEADEHIKNISKKFGGFVHAGSKVQLDAAIINEQLKMMIPGFQGEVPSQKLVNTKLSNSSSPMSSNKENSNLNNSKVGQETYSDDEVLAPRKMADGAEIPREEDDIADSEKKEKKSESNGSSENEDSRKRRRSILEEALITVLDIPEKRKFVPATPIGTTSGPTESNKELNTTTVQATNKDTQISLGKDNIVNIANSLTPSPRQKTYLKQVFKAKELTEKVTSPIKSKSVSKEKPSSEIRSLSIENQSKIEKPRRNSKHSQSLTDLLEKKKQVNINKTRMSISKSTESDSILIRDSPDKEDVIKEKQPVSKEKSNKGKSDLYDDNTSLAVLARRSSEGVSHLPTISNVCSLSATNVKTPMTTDGGVSKPIETVKDKQNTSKDSLVGQIGVRSFARMTSPPEKAPENVQVEVKAEPMEFEDAERQAAKIDLLNSFSLRPVSQSLTSLREIRINKITSAPTKKSTKPLPEIRPRAKKTFPQPRKPDEGRSELNSKNSMVYIPIQPPSTQPPLRPMRPQCRNITATQPASSTSTTTSANVTVNTVTAPAIPSVTLTSSLTSCTSTVTTQAVNQLNQLPSSVHKVPLITSVNGQWTLSLQPMMSVDPPMMNGIGDHTIVAVPPVMATAPTTFNTGPVTNTLLPAPALLPTTAGSTDLPRGEPPQLQQRPSLLHPLDAATPIGDMPTPSAAGPLTAKLNQNAVKLADFFRILLEDSLDKVDDPALQVTQLKLQLETLKWRHEQQMAEFNYNSEVTLSELRGSYEKEKARAVSEARRTCQMELDAAVNHAKSKQWCANCRQEAQFYCCWNTSYCDYPCQRAHWTQHFASCTQQRQDGSDNSTPPEGRLLPADKGPKPINSSLTVGGKVLPPNRVMNQLQSPPGKTSIIVSMQESGSIKCVGSYKAPSVSQSSIIINNQLLSSEEASKKVVTSGGYLIVGTSNVSTPQF